MIPQLQECYKNATNSLIGYTEDVRTEENDNSGKYSIKTSQVNKLFASPVWEEKKAASGHRKFKNAVTKIVVEYAAHQKDIDPGAAETILDQVQEHLNILNNVIFDYKTRNFKKEPDYRASAERATKWQNREYAGTPIEHTMQTIHGEKLQ